MGHTTISIDEELRKKAKNAQLNISGLTEWAIREKLNEKIIKANETLVCEFCGMEGYKETAEDVKENKNEPNALTWLCPEEKLICNRCLKIKKKI